MVDQMHTIGGPKIRKGYRASKRNKRKSERSRRVPPRQGDEVTMNDILQLLRGWE